MPLGMGVTAEEQITGKAEHGGLQIIAYPMKREAYEKHFPPRPHRGEALFQRDDNLSYCVREDMGLAPGGRMKQDIYEDKYRLDEWDMEQSSRCFVHISNSLVWHQITGEQPPTVPPTSKEYTEAGLPWFDYYDDRLAALKGSTALKNLKSVAQLSKKKGPLLPENEPVKPVNVIKLRAGLKPGQVREWVNTANEKSHRV